MIKKILIINIILFYNIYSLFSQSFKEQFDVLLDKQDTIEQKRFLEKWKNSNNNDPDLYVSYFNYYILQSKKEEATEIIYKSNILKFGFNYIKQGIKKFPNRLDMRFGYIHMLGINKDYKNFTQEIIKTINYSSKINNQWLWTNNKVVDNSTSFLLEAIQDYVSFLYDTNDDFLLKNIKKISKSVLKKYPQNVEFLTNIGIVYILQKKNNKGLKFLLQAENISPNNIIVLSNIANAHKQQGNKDKAITYYEKIIKFCDIEYKDFAEEQIENLKK